MVSIIIFAFTCVFWLFIVYLVCGFFVICMDGLDNTKLETKEERDKRLDEAALILEKADAAKPKPPLSKVDALLEAAGKLL